MTALMAPPRRKPARGWRGWRGPTPEKPYPSLGWLWLDWAYAFLPSPQDENRPLVYTDEQARRIVAWGELDPITGEFVDTTMILEEAKGWGKSPFAGSLDAIEFKGPVRFGGWDADGEPVGVPWGWGDLPAAKIQIAAVSEDQTENTYGALYSMLASRDGKVADAIRVDLGRTRLYDRDNPDAFLMPVTASAGSRTGQRIVKATLDETWLWTKRNGGTNLAATIRHNLTKMNGRSVETTNSPMLGSGSVAEQSDPDRPERGVLHYATRPSQAPDPSWPDDRLAAELDRVHRDVPWAPKVRILADVRNPRNPWDDSVRLFFNTRTAGAGRAVDPRRWDALAKPKDIPAGARVGVGFDGSISQDATVIRICDAEGYSRRFRAWERPAGVELDRWFAAHPHERDWHVDRRDVDLAVVDLFATYDVGLMWCDTPNWRTEIEGWAAKYGTERVMAFDTNSWRRFSGEVDRWLTAIREGTHTHDADPLTDRHVKAAHLAPVRVNDDESDGRTRYVLVKGEDKGRIDGAVTDVLAFGAAMTMPPSSPKVARRSRWVGGYR